MKAQLIELMNGNWSIVDPEDEDAPLLTLTFSNELAKLPRETKQQIATAALVSLATPQEKASDTGPLCGLHGHYMVRCPKCVIEEDRRSHEPHP